MITLDSVKKPFSALSNKIDELTLKSLREESLNEHNKLNEEYASLLDSYVEPIERYCSLALKVKTELIPLLSEINATFNFTKETDQNVIDYSKAINSLVTLSVYDENLNLINEKGNEFTTQDRNSRIKAGVIAALKVGSLFTRYGSLTNPVGWGLTVTAYVGLGAYQRYSNKNSIEQIKADSLKLRADINELREKIFTTTNECVLFERIINENIISANQIINIIKNKTKFDSEDLAVKLGQILQVIEFSKKIS